MENEKLQVIFKGITEFQTEMQELKAEFPTDKESNLEEIYQSLQEAMEGIEELLK